MKSHINKLQIFIMVDWENRNSKTIPQNCHFKFSQPTAESKTQGESEENFRLRPYRIRFVESSASWAFACISHLSSLL